jgi:hypothetical protein
MGPSRPLDGSSADTRRLANPFHPLSTGPFVGLTCLGAHGRSPPGTCGGRPRYPRGPGTLDGLRPSPIGGDRRGRFRFHCPLLSSRTGSRGTRTGDKTSPSSSSPSSGSDLTTAGSGIRVGTGLLVPRALRAAPSAPGDDRVEPPSSGGYCLDGPGLSPKSLLLEPGLSRSRPNLLAFGGPLRGMEDDRQRGGEFGLSRYGVLVGEGRRFGLHG